MNTQLKLVQPTPEENAELFAEFNKWYPHNPKRRKAAKARAMFKKVSVPGGCITQSLNKDSNQFEPVEHDVTPEELVEAAKAYRKAMIPARTGEYSPDTTYVPAAYVWLNSGDYQDYVEDE